MSKQLSSLLSSLQIELNELKKLVKSIQVEYITRNDIREKSKELSSLWFHTIEGLAQGFEIPDAVVDFYHQAFEELLKFSIVSKTRKISYMNLLDRLLKDFNKDLLIPSYKSSRVVASFPFLDKILDYVTDEEQEYLQEAVFCAGHGFLRASTVLGWCAAVHRMHKKIEKLGFDQFNEKSREMKNKKKGHYKRFNKEYEVSSLSEFRASVFDTDMLWVLEYWGLIDYNQHQRLSACFIMRNNAAHPGEAGISEENLISFFSDLRDIIFKNPKFSI